MAVTEATKAAVRARAKGRCEYCRCPESFAAQPLSVEHVVPRTRGGTDDSENLALSCQGCNNHKYSKTESFDQLSRTVVPFFQPRGMRWHEHFGWSDDYCDVVPLTPAGRVTVRELCLNRPGLRNLRRVLYAAGEHPSK